MIASCRVHLSALLFVLKLAVRPSALSAASERHCNRWQCSCLPVDISFISPSRFQMTKTHKGSVDFSCSPTFQPLHPANVLTRGVTLSGAPASSELASPFRSSRTLMPLARRGQFRPIYIVRGISRKEWKPVKIQAHLAFAFFGWKLHRIA